MSQANGEEIKKLLDNLQSDLKNISLGKLTIGRRSIEQTKIKTNVLPVKHSKAISARAQWDQ